MNELFFYGGVVLTIFFLVLSVVIFIKFKIIEVLKYYFMRVNKKKFDKSYISEFTRNIKAKTMGLRDSTEILGTANTDSKDGEEENTDILDIAKNYATALLDAESTVFLPEIEENEELIS